MIYKGTDLKWILPHIYLTSDQGVAVYVISPWLDIDIELYPTWLLDSGGNWTFSRFITHLSERGITTIFILSETERDNVLNIKSTRIIEEYGLEYHYIRNLHTKAVVGQRLMYIGSANLTYSGLNRNQEAVTIERVHNQEESLKQILGGFQLWQSQKVR